jgi:hypothetical protein
MWAEHEFSVLQLLAWITLTQVLLGGLWLIAGSADREIKRRNKR